MANEQQQEFNEEECTHDCSTCSANCSSKQQKPEDLLLPPNQNSKIGKVIAVMSGKGGVRKSMTSALLATAFQKKGYKTAILDADITGPSIPKAFGIKYSDLTGCEEGMLPPRTKTGIKIISTNLLLQEEETPVIWRGPIIAGMVNQFWQETYWDEVDYMFVDMPPGTGDVPLTVFQSLPIDGIVVVTTPQDLVSMIVAKAVNMARLMNKPILGIVENMSYMPCPDCGKKLYPFGESKIEEVADKYTLDILAKMPIDPKIAAACDNGDAESIDSAEMNEAMDKIVEKLK